MGVASACAAMAVMGMAAQPAFGHEMESRSSVGCNSEAGFELSVSPGDLYRTADAGGYYGSGQVVTVTVTPQLPSFCGTVMLSADSGVTSPLVPPPADTVSYGLYYPLSFPPQDGPMVEVDFPTPNDPNAVPPPRKAYLEVDLAENASGIAPGNYAMEVCGQFESQIGPLREYTAPMTITVSEMNVQNSAAQGDGAFNGPYYTQTSGSYAETNLPHGYDAIRDTNFNLPTTDPAISQVVRHYADDSAWIYSGGLASDRYNNNSTALDCGFQLGHTGNFGWKPGGLCMGERLSPETGGGDEIQGGQPLTVTFEAPGYTDPTNGTVPDYQVWLVVDAPAGQKFAYSVDDGNSVPQASEKVYKFQLPIPNNPPPYDEWHVTGDTYYYYQLKRTNSIAQTIAGNELNAPANYTKVLYTSGSFESGGGWYASQEFHEVGVGWGAANKLDTLTSPAAQYVAAGYVDTLGKGR
jgi:hypothetical protein